MKSSGSRSQPGGQSRSETVSTTSDGSIDKQNAAKTEKEAKSNKLASDPKQEESKGPTISSEPDDDNNGLGGVVTEDEQQNEQPAIDFVLYLQQTGSIIALVKLMDALEYGDNDDFDDAELKLIRQQQMLGSQATT